MDDIIITPSTGQLLRHLMHQLHSEFAMTHLGALSFFIGILVTRTADDMVLSKRQYAMELLQRAGMLDFNPCATPIDVKCKLSAQANSILSDPTEHRSYTGALQYFQTLRMLSSKHASICTHLGSLI